MSYGGLAALSRYARTGLLDVIRADYIRTARKGSSEGVVIIKHAARNGMIPIITLMATLLPVLIGGSVIIEVIFGIPGMGSFIFSSILQKDYNAVMVVLLISSLLTLIGMLLADLTYALVDRITFNWSHHETHTEHHGFEPEDLSFSDIVWQQFKKNRLALGSLWLLGLLFALAVGAPLLLERPFIWSDASGLYFPWFASLFDHNYYENGIDKFFNLLLVLGTPLLGTWLLLQRKIGASNIKATPAVPCVVSESGSQD